MQLDALLRGLAATLMLILTIASNLHGQTYSALSEDLSYAPRVITEGGHTLDMWIYKGTQLIEQGEADLVFPHGFESGPCDCSLGGLIASSEIALNLTPIGSNANFQDLTGGGCVDAAKGSVPTDWIRVQVFDLENPMSPVTVTITPVPEQMTGPSIVLARSPDLHDSNIWDFPFSQSPIFNPNLDVCHISLSDAVWITPPIALGQMEFCLQLDSQTRGTYVGLSDATFITPYVRDSAICNSSYDYPP